ncbi:hypothetical protein LZ30DRAFT_108377 [Colletotrichum cereale]|nr:hypothetical protein LZ30DRAFT_108377 [Colletotrichum cereale]
MKPSFVLCNLMVWRNGANTGTAIQTTPRVSPDSVIITTYYVPQPETETPVSKGQPRYVQASPKRRHDPSGLVSSRCHATRYTLRLSAPPLRHGAVLNGTFNDESNRTMAQAAAMLTASIPSRALRPKALPFLVTLPRLSTHCPLPPSARSCPLFQARWRDTYSLFCSAPNLPLDGQNSNEQSLQLPI